MVYVIYPNLSKRAAFRTALQVCERLFSADSGACIRIEQALEKNFGHIAGVTYLPEQALFRGADFAIAIGGDGTILQCANRILNFAALSGTPPVRLVGINTGTLGFLAAFEATELDMLAKLQSGNFKITNRALLQTSFTAPDGSVQTRHAMNDVYASRLNGRICDFAVSVDGKQIGIYRADGIIFATPTGSTAYALSAGGPVMEPDLSLIEMVLICPHSLFARPMLFPPQRRIEVTYRGAGDGGLNVHADGKKAIELHNSQSFAVTGSDRIMPFVDCKGHAFYDALNGKLMQPLKGMRTD